MTPRPRREPELLTATTTEGRRVPVQVGLDRTRRMIAVRFGGELAYLTPHQVTLLRQALADKQSQAIWNTDRS